MAELLAADTVVIAAGLINFAVPSTLKAWLDHVARAGETFRYSEKGPEGLVTGRKVYLVIASGGVYSDGPAAAFDHAVPYLRTMLGLPGHDGCGTDPGRGLWPWGRTPRRGPCRRPARSSPAWPRQPDGGGTARPQP